MTEPMPVDLRVVFWIVWGVGTVVVYGLLLRRRRKHYLRHRDRRAFRDQTASLGYFLIAVLAFLGITFALFGEIGGRTLGGLLFAVASGGYFIVGLYSLLEREPESGVRGPARRQ